MINIGTTRVSSRGQVVIPLEMRKDLKKGDKLLVIRRGDEIILKKTFPETAILAEKSLSEAWMSKEDEEAFSYLQ